MNLNHAREEEVKNKIHINLNLYNKEGKQL